MSAVIEGIAVSDGIAFAKAFHLASPELTVEKKSVQDTKAEKERLKQALATAKEELKAIREHTRKELGEEQAAIFSAHLLVLEDPELITPIEEKIEQEQQNAESALDEVVQTFIALFESMDNEYMKERAADIRDVTKRVLAHLLGIEIPNLNALAEDVIIIAEDLTPSETAQLNQYVRGFVTDIGGRTSHSAIMARSMELPAVVGTKSATAQIKTGQFLIVDGTAGKVILDPSEETMREYEAKRNQFQAQKQEWAKLVHEQSVTADGVQLELAANIGTVEDVQAVLDHGGEGVGLFRTEFLYMGRTSLPTEEEQFEVYKTVLERMAGKPVVVRTLDIGGDKELPYLDLPKEMNPFLGFRAIRLCLEREDIFRTQLRALLRASVYGNLKIMFPMIATLDEFRAAKNILLAEKGQLQTEGSQVAERIELGIMVEIPSTAILADLFAQEVDFFSIGTNDLIQYTFAADRMNERVAYLYQPYNPAILRLIKTVIDAAHREGKWVGMCGEMAGDEIAIPLLVGLGLDEFSMSATSILKARSQIRQLSQAELAQQVAACLQMSRAEDVVAFVQQNYMS